MYGYKEPMASINMRDGIIPMTTDRKISISYKAFGNRVDSVSYEVTAPDTGVVIENAKIGNFRSVRTANTGRRRSHWRSRS